ncbi:hypothetical protein [Erwinia typographi]|uniref:hypothetical protein n=1 Tax=Erwinia typographi TaxID=371042 RepID=UPI0012EDBFAA|nr:hypothetical protein [Erwinia typographi]
MTPQVKACRESLIKHCSLRVHYRKTYSPRIPASLIAAMLVEIEEANEEYRRRKQGVKT